MTASAFGKLRLYSVTLVAVLVLLTGSLTYPQDNNKYSATDEQSYEINPKVIANLEMGLKSENIGVRRCCVYYAGFYEIQQLVKPLMNQLAEEKDVNTRVLIALTLYKIGNQEGIAAIEGLALVKNYPVETKVNDAILKNLRAGINSSNLGLRKSSIFMAGFYKIQELTGDLTQILKKETDTETKVLTAISLYNIGDSKGINAIRALSKENKYEGVDNIGKEILEKLVVSSGYPVSAK